MPRIPLTLAALSLAASAHAQDGSGADLLDISRRAAVVDDVLAHHAATIRDSEPFGIDSSVRMASGISYYLVSDLELDDGLERYPVELNRAYSGFLIDAKLARDATGDPRATLWLAGGGISYGLQRPYTLPIPDGVEPSDKADLAGEQFTDEQYSVGGSYRRWSLEGAWARGQVLSSTEQGQADVSTLTERLQRIQVSANTPLGLSVTARAAVGGELENIGVDLAVNEAVAAGTGSESAPWIPAVDLGFRRSSYGGVDPRDNPRVLGLGLSEDLGWLTDSSESAVRHLGGSVRGQVVGNLAGEGLQLALAESELTFEQKYLEAHVFGGVSTYRDDGLIPVIGTNTTPGYQAGMRFAMALWMPSCSEKNPDCRPASGKMALSGAFRESWAEELRYVADFAGRSQSTVYLEFMGGK